MIDTWTCHVCGKERPDAKISVYSSTKYSGSIPIQQNVRYCNDDPSCIEGAKLVDFMGKTKSIESAIYNTPASNRTIGLLLAVVMGIVLLALIGVPVSR